MARPREFDTDQALDAAMETFWREGYASSAISDLVDATGVGRASLYNAFEDKHGLFEACLRRYADGRVPAWLDELTNGEQGLDDIRAFFDRRRDVAEDSPEHARMGCLIVNSSVERGPTDPVVTETAASYRAKLTAAFEAALARAAERGELQGPANGHAEVLLLSATGLFVAMRAGAAAEEIDRLVSGINALLDGWAAQP